MRALTATISAGGSGYLVGDILTISGTTGTAAQLTVATLSGSAVATVTISTQGNMTALPTNPASVTGGTGTGATFTMTYGLAITQPSPSNAGSGYVEQPTVSFSGGGGCGATAYATVGSCTVIRTLGSSSVTSRISFQTPAGEQVRITDPGNTTVNYIAMWGGASGVAPRFVARGTDADVSLLYSVKGAGNHVFRTNDTNQTQFQISHTASAVNYVQVTGATTASKVVAISAQGSDTDVTLSLSPKGAGTIRFGTHTGTILTPTGYITITDSGGTTRRLLVG